MRALLLLGCALGFAAGCGNSQVAVTALQPPAPPQVLATQPAPRSTGVLYTTPITVDFTTDMDPATLTTTNVFLKLDTQRVPIVLQWDAVTRRLQVLPDVALRLRRTYTVELTSGVRTADGADFGAGGWFFQFTTNGARLPDHARPLAGAVDESPFVMVSWDSTEASAGPISYQVWGGTDSAAVAVRAGSPRATSSRASWLPSVAWPLGERVYWAVTVVNGATGERLDGPVHAFETLPSGTAIDSVLILADDFGYNAINVAQSATNPFQTCSADSVVSATGTQGWITFPFGLLPADVRVASARLEAYTFDHYLARLSLANPGLWSARLEWPHPCRSNLQLPQSLPIRDQLLAGGRLESGRRVIFMSDLLASHVEASVRRGGLFGYELSSQLRLAYSTPRFFDPSRHPYLKIHFYRTAPAPLASHAP